MVTKFKNLSWLCDFIAMETTFGSVFGKRDLLAFFHVMKYDVLCGTCLHKFDCRNTILSNAANHFKVFLIELEICLYKHLYFLYIRNPLFPSAVFISMLWQLKVNMFYPKNSFSNCIKHPKISITFLRDTRSTHCLQD